jgi:large-conductance mechanosensitive channel
MQELYNSGKLYLINGINEIKIIFISIVVIILNFLILNLKDFIKFLFDKNIIQLAISILIATQIGTFVNSINTYIITPILINLPFMSNLKAEDINYTILGIQFQIGKILIIFLNFIFTLILIFCIWKISLLPNYNFITNYLTEIKLKIE